MNQTTHNSTGSGSAEETLRLIASLPAPEGLEERVHAALLRDPHRGRVLAWPTPHRPVSAWMRTAAAAAIVFVVAGGGWSVYLHVDRGESAKTIVVPRVPISGGFSSAGAIRTPQTLNGPMVTHPAPGRTSQTQTPKKMKTKAHEAAAGVQAPHRTTSGEKAAPPIAAPPK